MYWDSGTVAAFAACVQSGAAIAAASPFLVIESFEAGRELADATLHLRNAGTAKAVVVAQDVRIVFAEKLPSIGGWDDRHEEGWMETERLIDPGSRFEVKRLDRVASSKWDAFEAGRSRLFLVGYVDYLDFRKIRLREGFGIEVLCKKDGVSLDNFRRIHDRAYNYNHEEPT